MDRMTGRRNNPTILIVEDDDVLRMVLRIEFEKNGYKVREAENGRAGLTSFEEMHPDAIITDIEMPVMNGINFIAEVRKENNQAEVPIIAISASKIANVGEKAVAAGANRFYEKPFATKNILTAVNTYLSSGTSSQN